MVMPLPIVALGISLVVVVLIALAEWIHGRRIGRVRYLAFGPTGQPRRWVAMVPFLRILSVATLTWGSLVLLMLEPTAIEKEPTAEASKHLLVCLDASPSMFVVDSGPDGKMKRAIWAGEVIQAILDRLDPETTRVTVFAVYTKSIPVIEDTFDMNVVRNLLDGLPLFAAFEAGPTRLSTGVNDALAYAKEWKPKSATLLVVSDGDSEERLQIRSIPSSIADTIVVGVGDPVRPTMVAGHRSTQDVASLKSLATKMKGVYHQGNSKHLPSAIVNKLTMIRPRIGEGMGLREWALVALGFGGVLLGLIGPALRLFGRDLSGHPAVSPTKGLVSPTKGLVSPTNGSVSPTKGTKVRPQRDGVNGSKDATALSILEKGAS